MKLDRYEKEQVDADLKRGGRTYEDLAEFAHSADVKQLFYEYRSQATESFNGGLAGLLEHAAEFFNAQVNADCIVFEFPTKDGNSPQDPMVIMMPLDTWTTFTKSARRRTRNTADESVSTIEEELVGPDYNFNCPVFEEMYDVSFELVGDKMTNVRLSLSTSDYGGSESACVEEMGPVEKYKNDPLQFIKDVIGAQEGWSSDNRSEFFAQFTVPLFMREFKKDWAQSFPQRSKTNRVQDESADPLIDVVTIQRISFGRSGTVASGTVTKGRRNEDDSWMILNPNDKLWYIAHSQEVSPVTKRSDINHVQDESLISRIHAFTSSTEA